MDTAEFPSLRGPCAVSFTRGAILAFRAQHGEQPGPCRGVRHK